ncbi:hypothetical protein D1BOALGB6SA_4615 [Olavius sp. associated proteobacterium Delta 1]|nr:hypothetical protein D1BOALGB6SA_4615 [Olavius sp. associated proteobacterium Delta 1]
MQDGFMYGVSGKWSLMIIFFWSLVGLIVFCFEAAEYFLPIFSVWS